MGFKGTMRYCLRAPSPFNQVVLLFLAGSMNQVPGFPTLMRHQRKRATYIPFPYCREKRTLSRIWRLPSVPVIDFRCLWLACCSDTCHAGFFFVLYFNELERMICRTAVNGCKCENFLPNITYKPVLRQEFDNGLDFRERCCFRGINPYHPSMQIGGTKNTSLKLSFIGYIYGIPGLPGYFLLCLLTTLCALSIVVASTTGLLDGSNHAWIGSASAK